MKGKQSTPAVPISIIAVGGSSLQTYITSAGALPCDHGTMFVRSRHDVRPITADISFYLGPDMRLITAGWMGITTVY